MPITLKKTAKAAPEDNTALWRRLLAGGLRVGSGVLSSAGLGAGAAIAGAGEYAAQAAEELGTGEGFTPNKKRIAIEAAIGAVPFGKVVKGVANGGKIAFDAAKSAAMTASGEALRQGYASDDAGYLPDTENIGWGSVGLAGLLGLGGGAIGSKWAAARKPKAPVVEDVVEHTAQPGGRVLGPGGKLESVPQSVVIRSGAQTSRPRVSTEVPYRMAGAVEDVLEPKAAVPYGAVDPAPYRSAAKAAQKAEDAGIDSEALLREQDAAARRAQYEGLDFGPTVSQAGRLGTKWSPERVEELALRYESIGDLDTADQIRRAGTTGPVPYSAADPAPYRPAAKAAQRAEDLAAENQRKLELAESQKTGLEPQTPSVSETVEGVRPDGTKVRATTKFDEPDAAAGDELTELLTTGKVSSRKGGKRWKDVNPDDLPPEGSPQLAILEEWLKRGRSPKRALKLAAKNRIPPGSGIEIPGVRRVSEQPLDAPVSPVQQTSEMVETAPQSSPENTAAVLKELLGILPTELGAKVATQTPEVIEQLARQIPEAAPVAAKIADDVPLPGPGSFEPVADDAGDALLRFFKSPLEAAGEGYGAIKAAKAAGEEVPEEGRRIAGQAAQRLRKEAGVPPTPRPAPVYPEPTTGGSWVDEQRAVVDELLKAKAAGRPFTTSMNLGGLSSDLARIIQEDPEFATQLFAGAAGAGIGAATSDDPLTGALMGGVGGFVAPKAIPAMLRDIGTPVDALRNIEISIQTPEGIKDAAQKIFTSLPQVQRFNYLAGVNLIPNSVAGPWGAAFIGALEHGLAGDPRGWAAIRELRNIPKFVKDTAMTNMEESRQLLHAGHMGRVESGLLDYGPEKLREAIGWPGIQMTSGDLSARKILLAAGFSEDEARRITLTSEPVGETFRTLAEAGKNSVPIQMLMPFRRTPANIAQQGLQRMPLIGSLMDQQGTPMNQQLISQLLLTPAVAGANYAVGANVDPETAKWLRPWMSNLGGQYSLAGGIGFAAGQAHRRGQPVAKAIGQAAVRDAFPLPTTDSAENLYNWLFTKQTPTPNPFTDLEGFIREAPRGTVPSIAKSFVEETAGTGIPSQRRRIRLRSQ